MDNNRFAKKILDVKTGNKNKGEKPKKTWLQKIERIEKEKEKNWKR